MLLAIFGAGLGLLLAFAGIRILRTFIPSSISQIQAISIDGTVLIFTALVAVLTGIAFGLAPAIHGSHLNLNDTLKESGRDSAGCLLYTSPSPRDRQKSRMPSSA